ncbi:MAG: hypothetical protein QM674_04855 [Burkholderiaceae bacterium]
MSNRSRLSVSFRIAAALASFAHAAALGEEATASSALVLDAFVQVSPSAGATPTRRTEVRFRHDARTLFVEIRAFDPEPDAIFARQMRRDVEGMLAEDQVTLVIDVEGAGRNGYLFAVNALGAQFDALVYDGGQMRFDWDAQWLSEASIDAEGWHARLAIPLAVFGQTEAAHWRLNAERWMPRGSERVRLAGAWPDRPVHSLGTGLAVPAVRPGSGPGPGSSGDAGADGGAGGERGSWGLRIKPSLRLVSESSAASGTGRASTGLEPGLELFHESARGLRSALALNLDFGEAEADERTVNLSRFELFRLEKREFFLRDAGRFSFGGLVETAVIPYYSRRIGLDAGGWARSLDAGLKLTGNVAGVDFGVFGARVAGGPTSPGEPDQAPADVAVLRLARPLDARQRLGLIATHGNPRGSAGSGLWGLDYQFRDPGWAGNRTLEAHAWAMRSRNPGALTGQAWGASLSFLNLGPMAEVRVQRIGSGFEPALGYLAEDNVMRGQGTVGWWHRTAAGTDIIPAIDWNWRRTLDGRERTLSLNPEVAWTTPAGDTVMAEVFFDEDRLTVAHELVPGVAIAPGNYRWHYLYGIVETAHSRPLWIGGEWRAGGYYDGRRNDQVATVGWKPTARWEARVGLGRNDITLPSGHFTVKLATLRLDHASSTRQAQNLLLQWDNVSRSLGISIRWRWQWAPGREALFALDRLGHTGERRTLEPHKTRAMLKLVWNFER